MLPADALLSHFDKIAGRSGASFFTMSPEGERPVLHVAAYRDAPENGVLTAFTAGLSHFHPPGGGHKELMIRMRDDDFSWALAVGFLAYQLRERCPFVCGNTLNFREQIAPSSSMNGFVVTHPVVPQPSDAVVNVGDRRVELARLVPVFEQERIWLLGGGNLKAFLESFSGSELIDPCRKSYIAA
jgi:hypothetical protein